MGTAPEAEGTLGNGLFETDALIESPLASFVLKPKFFKTDNKSAFWTGFVSEATKRCWEGDESTAVYALTEMMGVFVFLLLVLLMYCAAASPSIMGMLRSSIITSKRISPLATLAASEPSATTMHRHPIRVKRVSKILAEIGLSSAINTFKARSDECAELRLRAVDPASAEDSDDPVACAGGVLGEGHRSEMGPPGSTLDTEAVLSRLGTGPRRPGSPSP